LFGDFPQQVGASNPPGGRHGGKTSKDFLVLRSKAGKEAEERGFGSRTMVKMIRGML